MQAYPNNYYPNVLRSTLRRSFLPVKGRAVAAIKLGEIYVIPLFLDYTWFIIFALIVWTMGAFAMLAEFPHQPTFTLELIVVVLSALLYSDQS